MHPSEAEGFELDEANEGKLSAHRILGWEVYEVFENRPIWIPNKRSGSGDYKMVGRNDGGRRLTIIVEVKEHTKQLRPITGWPSSQSDITLYDRRRRR
jgi:hypothetical protein